MTDPDATLAPPPDAGGDTQTLPPSPRAAAAPTGPPAVEGYEIEGELGRGGMGVVYKARQEKLNRTVALKMVLAGGHASAQERLRFLAEAEAVAAVQHPGIVQVFEFGTSGEQPFFALEFCPGGSLGAKLAGTPLRPREAAELVEKVARAVQAAHEQGIVHRDLKPDNVLFAADGTPKVTDFGLARKVQGDSGLTRTGAIMGSPSYMAPEQAAGKKDVGPAADVWALGAILYECLTGRPPFRAATALDTVMQVTTADPVPPRTLVPGVPRDLETVCLKCLQKEPGKRYAAAAALADDLRRFLNDEPITARPVGSVERMWKLVRRRPAVLAIVALGALAAGAVLVAGVTLVIAYHEIQSERDAAKASAWYAVEQQNAALVRQKEADAQRKKAQARLEKAVEAVDKVLNRVGSERWARTPELLDERRLILEDVVAFYASFKDDDANDPLVRREAARALFRIGAVYLMVDQAGRAEPPLAAAAERFASLVAENPADAVVRDELAQVTAFRGHAAVLNGKTQDGLSLYEQSVHRAEEAVAAAPDSDAAKITLSETLQTLSSGLANDPAQAAKVAALRGRALQLAEKVAEKPGASYPARLALAQCLTSLGVAEIERPATQAAARQKLARVEMLLGDLDHETAPTARHRNILDITRIGYDALRGAVLATQGKPADALKAAEEATARCDQFLALYPRFFPVRMQKISILGMQVRLLTLLKKPDEAAERRRDVIAQLERLRSDSPQFTWLPAMIGNNRVLALLEDAKAGRLDGVDAAAAELLARHPGPESDGLRYNLACVLSHASKHGTPADKEARAAKAVALLAGLIDGPFYKGPTNAAHVDKDDDLAAVRGRADYKAFRAKLAAANSR